MPNRNKQRGSQFQPPPEPRPAQRVTEPWRIAMNARPGTEDGKKLYKMRKQTVEPERSGSMSPLSCRPRRFQGYAVIMSPRAVAPIRFRTPIRRRH